EPAADTPPLEPSCNGSDYRTGSGDRSDDVSNPVDEVQERTFRLSAGLSLHGNICLRRTAEVLCPDEFACQQERDGEHGEQSAPYFAHLQLHVVVLLSGFQCFFKVENLKKKQPSRGESR